MNRGATVLAVSALIALAGVIAGVWAYGTCAFQRDTEDHAYLCYKNRLEIILAKHDAGAALEYTSDVVAPSGGYALVHVLLHRVGELTYRKDNGDLSKFNAYLVPYMHLAPGSGLIGGFDGFVHGYMTEYLATMGTITPESMEAMCTNVQLIPSVMSDTFGCYHTLGHALMFASGNEVDKALSFCDMNRSDTVRADCYYGAFMEDSFLYSSAYHQGSPRPDSTGRSMNALCKKYTGGKALECTQYIGDSYLIGHPGDVAGAFRECRGMANESVCVNRLATIVITSLSKTPAEAEALCSRYAGASQQTNCGVAAEAALALGFGIPAHTAFTEKAGDFLKTIGASFLVF